MDRKRWIYLIIMLCSLLVTSIGMFASYTEIYNVSNNENNVNIPSREEVYDLLFVSNFVIDYKLDNDQKNVVDKYLQIQEGSILEEAKKEGAYFNDLHAFEDRFEGWKMRLFESENLKYYAYDKNGNTYTNEDALNPTHLNEKGKEEYRMLLQVTFDGTGNVTYSTLHEKNEWYTNFIQMSKENDMSVYASDYFSTNYFKDGKYVPIITYNTPKDITIIYGIPNQLSYVYDEINYWYGSYHIHEYYIYLIPYTLLGVFLIVLVMLFMPYYEIKEIPLFRRLNKIKFEFYLLLYVGIFILYIVSAPELYYLTMYGELKTILTDIGMESLSNIIITILNILYYLLIYASIMHMMYSIKLIFSKGILRFIKENTVIGWMMQTLRRLLQYVKKCIYKVLNFDLQDETNKIILRIVGIQFIIISLISLLYVLGWIAALVYSFIIFVLLKNKLEVIQCDYKILLYATQQLSEGNFNVEIDQDLGIFNSLKAAFVNIKVGFKKAVDEEVKSQKMKTELISNVSHDLKTPLTSIITYVDLLKQENLEEEERNQYVNTLDRNAQRLKNLIEDLFEVSKVNSGNVNLDIVDVDLVSLVKQAQFECDDHLNMKHLNVRINTYADKIICPLDSLKTYRIFENLFMNISKYALENTRVYIEFIEHEKTVEIIFKNISAEEIHFNAEEITDRFVRGDKSRNSEGSGLGLAIAKSFTELQNGNFKIEVDGDLFKAILQFKKGL